MESSQTPAAEESGCVVNGGGVAMEVDPSKEATEGEEGATSEIKAPKEAEPEPEWVGHLRAMDMILSGSKTIALHQEFLIRNNNSDLQILKNTKVCD